MPLSTIVDTIIILLKAQYNKWAVSKFFLWMVLRLLFRPDSAKRLADALFLQETASGAWGVRSARATPLV